MQRVLEQFSRGKNWWENCQGLVQQQAPAHYWSHEVDVFRCHCYRLSKVCSVTDTLKKLFLFVFFSTIWNSLCSYKIISTMTKQCHQWLKILWPVDYSLNIGNNQRPINWIFINYSLISLMSLISFVW